MRWQEYINWDHRSIFISNPGDDVLVDDNVDTADEGVFRALQITRPSDDFTLYPNMIIWFR